MQCSTNVSIPSRRRHGKTVVQPGLDSEYSPRRREGAVNKALVPAVQNVQDWQKRYISVYSGSPCEYEPIWPIRISVTLLRSRSDCFGGVGKEGALRPSPSEVGYGRRRSEGSALRSAWKGATAVRLHFLRLANARRHCIVE